METKIIVPILGIGVIAEFLKIFLYISNLQIICLYDFYIYIYIHSEASSICMENDSLFYASVLE